MSSDILQPFSVPSVKKRACKSIPLPSEEAFKCAEIFVTNNADKWTFYCVYCQKATSDIGVFICHIRLEHLNAKRDLIVSKQTPELPGNVSSGFPLETNSNLNPMGELTTNTQPQPVQCEIVKEEVTIATNQENLQLQPICDIADNSLSNQNSIPKSQHPTAGDNEVIFTITPIDSQLPQEQSISEQDDTENTQVLYVRNEATAKNEFDDDTSTNEITKEDNNEKAEINDSESCYSPNEDDENDTDFEINDDNEASGSSKNKRMKRSKATSEDNSLATLNCPYCPVVFKRKQSYTRHILHTHDKKLPIICDKCQRGFLTASGLRVHLKSHDDKNHFQCPVCKTKHIENYFITHVLTHESASCFPCQVCGKLYTSQEERMSHWKTHSKEKPFACSICYRRYGKLHYLTRHLKSHYQYHCNFCPAEFNATEAQRPPYVCPKCEKLPDIKQRVEYLKSLTDGNHIFDSDKDIIKTSNDADDSTLNDNDNKDYAPNDKLVNDHDEEDPSNEDFSDLEDDLPTMSQTPLLHKCQYCKRDFNSKAGLVLHIRKSHISNNQFSYPFKCMQCQRAFQSKSALNHHTKFHDKNFQFKCPLCPTTKLGEGAFVAHVMLHETESCFPCQVCGKIYTNNEERMAHWETHVEEKPHGCEICYRRFSQKFVLQRHLKIHNQYDCHFCPEHFNSPNSLQPPYVCAKCEKLPDITAKIEQRRSLMSQRKAYYSRVE